MNEGRLIYEVELREANLFVKQHHRHHKPVQGHKWSLGLYENQKLVGVAICGRPVARNLDDGKTIEVTRLCTDGTRNACSQLYAASAKRAKKVGYKKIITYILESETGASLKASGWAFAGICGGGSWSRKSRERDDKAPLCKKQRWEKKFWKECDYEDNERMA